MPGKIGTSLNKNLQIVEWGKYRIGDLFEKIQVHSLKYKAKDLPDIKNKEYDLPALTAGIQNQGLNSYVPRNGATILKNVISISANGANTGAAFYQSKEFTVLQDAYAIKWINSENVLNAKHYLFLVGAIEKTLHGNYEWTNKAGWERIKNDIIQLPIKNNQIDFDFMESVITDIEMDRFEKLKGYLSSAGVSDYELTQEEKNIINNYNSLTWQKFNLEGLFGKADRGRRLKSKDRIYGSLPFVTAGETEEGISDFIGNEVQIFPENTTTIDMFGSAKYRNYEYGADDHVSVVHTENLNKFASIFVTSAIHKSSHNGQFNYGKNFYPKDANDLFIMLPGLNGNPDFRTMEIVISAIHKLVVKDLVIYVNNKLAEKKYKINNPYLMVNN